MGYIDSSVLYKAIKQMEKLQNKNGDYEIQHQEADGILCKILRANGYGDLVAEYHKVPKWYA
jgi:hypothetical protein